MLLVILLTMCLLIRWSFPCNADQGQIIHSGKFLLLNGKACFKELSKGNPFVRLQLSMASPIKRSGGWFVLLTTRGMKVEVERSPSLACHSLEQSRSFCPLWEN
jgi:hypothetical protein